MRHLAFFAVLALYVIIIGQNWSHYAAALMTAAYVKHDGSLTTKL